MATLSLNLTIPDAEAANALNDFCLYKSYQATVNGQANPETKAAFMKRMVAVYIKDCVKAQRSTAAGTAAITASIADTEAKIVLT